jgi:hypothetical protein
MSAWPSMSRGRGALGWDQLLAGLIVAVLGKVRKSD